MEQSELVYADIIKQEYSSEGEEDSWKSVQALKDEVNSSPGMCSNIKINQKDKYNMQYDVIEVKQEEEEPIIKAETYDDEETSFNNFMNTDITIDGDIKQEESKTYDQNPALSEHLEACKEKRKDECTNYGRTFSQKGKRFICTICDKTFTHKSQLTRHLFIHDETKQFKCTICNKAFILKSQLTRHLFIHEETKRFKCTICYKAFFLKSQLTQHILIHDEMKRFKCTICDKAFTVKSYLTRHLATHRGTK